MTLPIIKCPRCNHPQKWSHRERIVNGEHIQIYVKCKMCRLERVVVEGDRSTISNYKEIERLKVRAQNYPALNRVLKRKRNKLSE